MRGLPLDAGNAGSHNVRLGSVGDNPARPFYFLFCRRVWGIQRRLIDPGPLLRPLTSCVESRSWSYVDTEYLELLRFLMP